MMIFLGDVQLGISIAIEKREKMKCNNYDSIIIFRNLDREIIIIN